MEWQERRCLRKHWRLCTSDGAEERNRVSSGAGCRDPTMRKSAGAALFHILLRSLPIPSSGQRTQHVSDAVIGSLSVERGRVFQTTREAPHGVPARQRTPPLAITETAKRGAKIDRSPGLLQDERGGSSNSRCPIISAFSVPEQCAVRCAFR